MANVLQLLSSFKVGGLEKLLVDFLNCKGDTKFIVVVMNNKVDENLKEQLLKTGCQIYFLNRKEGHKHPKYLFQLLKIIKTHNINIIHSHNSGSRAWSILCKIFNSKLKLIYTIHDSVIIQNLSKIKLFLCKKFIDMNIAISNVIFDDCAKNKLKAVKIYNGIDVKKWENVPRVLDDEVFNIINIARITYQKKGQDVLIRALKECKNRGMKFKCSFVGGVYEYDLESFEYLKKLVDDLDLTQEVAFLGNRDDIAELLSKSNLFVLPSRFEGLPISLLEAMAAKIPIVASNINGCTDLIEHNQNGLLFESENHFDLTEKILFLYNNKEEINKLTKSAYEYVLRLDISTMYEKYCELYKRI